MKHTLRFPSGRFRPRLLRDAPLLDAMMRPVSEPHRKGWNTRRAKQSAERWAHIEAMQLEIAMKVGWL